MTKQEILKNKGEAWEYSNTLEVTPVMSAYVAMDEFAKVKSIGFANFISNHPLDFQTAGKDRWVGLDMKYVTSEELYELYLVNCK